MMRVKRRTARLSKVESWHAWNSKLWYLDVPYELIMLKMWRNPKHHESTLESWCDISILLLWHIIITIVRQSQQILSTRNSDSSMFRYLNHLPANKKIGKNLFFSSVAHQFQALVNLPSIQLPALKKSSPPEPSKPWRKKSLSISQMRLSAEPNSASI